MGITNMTKAVLHSTIFVSYRRNDAFAVDQLIQTLHHDFGQQKVIQDILSFEPGQSFPENIKESIRSCTLAIVVIGPNWSGDGGFSNNPSCDDWVRQEVEIAIASDRQILPILLPGGEMPGKAHLPETMHALLNFNALRLRPGEDATGDLRRIVAAVRKHVTRDWRRVACDLMFTGIGMAIAATGAAFFGAKIFFTDHCPLQGPNIILSLGAALLLPAFAAFQHVSRQWAAKWEKPLPLYRQPVLRSISIASLALALIALYLPESNLIDSLYLSLESTRKELPRSRKLLGAIKSKPCYTNSEDVNLIETVLSVRESTTLTEDKVNATLNALVPYMKQPDTRRRTWATLMSAEAYRFVNKFDEQLLLYHSVAEDSSATNWQRWYAFNELGTIYYSHKGSPSIARAKFEEALKYRMTVGVLQNLALLDEGMGDWESAYRRHQKALEAITAYKKEKQLVTLSDQEASLYSNWCSTQRNRANSTSDSAQQKAFRSDAASLCNKAIDRYTAHLDARWNLARIQIDAYDYETANSTLSSALEVIRNLKVTSPESLNRNGYDIYGERYTLWLLAVSRYLSKQSLHKDSMLRDDFFRIVVQQQRNATSAVGLLLSDMEQRDMTVNEDRKLLKRMTQSHFF